VKTTAGSINRYQRTIRANVLDERQLSALSACLSSDNRRYSDMENPVHGGRQSPKPPGEPRGLLELYQRYNATYFKIFDLLWENRIDLSQKDEPKVD
jgi:hypothetical protein